MHPMHPMHAMRKRLTLVFASAICLAAGASLAQYPSRPIRFIIGFPPGGSADPATRILGGALSEQMRQPVVVDNRPGADGALSAELAMRAPADGHTLLFGSVNAMTAAVVLRKVPAYDPARDFTPVSMMGRATQFLYIHPSVPAKTLSEFIAHAKANPGKMNSGIPNPLSGFQYIQLARATGTEMLQVPYKGEGPVTPDLLSARLHSSINSSGTAIALHKEGKLRALAVMLKNRSPLLPDVPTIDEAGAPQVTVRHWAGVFGPAKLPGDIVARLNKEINIALARGDVREKFLSFGYAIEGSTPEALAEISRNDLVLWRKLVKEANVPLD
jgi:tripartite-type tricarboxylate transporter receptor subunit TctC